MTIVRQYQMLTKHINAMNVIDIDYIRFANTDKAARFLLRNSSLELKYINSVIIGKSKYQTSQTTEYMLLDHLITDAKIVIFIRMTKSFGKIFVILSSNLHFEHQKGD